MSLQGTLETIPLADVLSLLAATKKSGELRITGSRADGRVWLDAGGVVGTDVPRAATPVDAVFELLRLTAGTFSFESGAAAPAPGAPVPVDGLLNEAQARLEVWRGIEAVVPSMSCAVGLAAELARENVTVSKKQWKELVAVAGGGDVNGVMARLGLGEFDTCRTVKDLVDSGLAEVSPAPARQEAVKEPERQQAQAQAPQVKAQPAKPVPRPAVKLPEQPVPRPEQTVKLSERQPEQAQEQPETEPQKEPQNPAASRSPSREEAEELVHQLASLSKAPPRKATPTEPAGGKPADAEPTARHLPPRPAARAIPVPAQEPASESATPAPAVPGEEVQGEPINRGMLLKFLSSVRP